MSLSQLIRRCPSSRVTVGGYLTSNVGCTADRTLRVDLVGLRHQSASLLSTTLPVRGIGKLSKCWSRRRNSNSSMELPEVGLIRPPPNSGELALSFLRRPPLSPAKPGYIRRNRGQGVPKSACPSTTPFALFGGLKCVSSDERGSVRELSLIGVEALRRSSVDRRLMV